MPVRFTVQVPRSVEKDFKDLKPYHKQAIESILVLEDDPFKGHMLQGSLRGLRSLEFSLPNGGVCRAVYKIKTKEHVCLLIIVGYHENIYAKAERRARTLRKN